MKKDEWNIQFRRCHFINTIVPFSKQTRQDFAGKQNVFYIVENQEPLIPYKVPSMVFPTHLQLPTEVSRGTGGGEGRDSTSSSGEILHVERNLLLPGYLKTTYEMSLHTLKITLKTLVMTCFVFLNAPSS